MMSARTKKKVLVAMSGGVDSAMAARLLMDLGFEVTGVHFVMDKRKAACQQEAQALAAHLGIPCIVKDISGDFQTQVFNYFVQAYGRNITPNPCVICNPLVKFSHLINVANDLGIDKIATGHYARIIRQQSGDVVQCLLVQAVDAKKDQSYFLYRLSQDQLKRTLFPLGEYTKDRIKAMAREIALPIKSGESQDACFFLEGERVKDVLSQRVQMQPGDIQDEQGNVLGRHQGLVLYTQGQRYGLQLSGGPYYVIAKDPGRNVLTVSKHREHPWLMNQELVITDAHWIVTEPILDCPYTFRSRYQVKPTIGSFVGKDSQGRWRVRFTQPQWAVAIGQSLVVYDNDVVVGGGIIEATQF